MKTKLFLITIFSLLFVFEMDGQVTFQKTYSLSGNDEGYVVQETTDGGYVIAGATNVAVGGMNDVYLLKTDVNGDTLWTKTFGGTGFHGAYSIRQTTDGGYIIAAWTGSFSNSDIFLIKTDVNGDSVWTKSFGGTNLDEGISIQQTSEWRIYHCGKDKKFWGRFL